MNVGSDPAGRQPENTGERAAEDPSVGFGRSQGGHAHPPPLAQPCLVLKPV